MDTLLVPKVMLSCSVAFNSDQHPPFTVDLKNTTAMTIAAGTSVHYTLGGGGSYTGTYKLGAALAGNGETEFLSPALNQGVGYKTCTAYYLRAIGPNRSSM